MRSINSAVFVVVLVLAFLSGMQIKSKTPIVTASLKIIKSEDTTATVPSAVTVEKPIEVAVYPPPQMQTAYISTPVTETNYTVTVPEPISITSTPEPNIFLFPPAPETCYEIPPPAEAQPSISVSLTTPPVAVISTVSYKANVPVAKFKSSGQEDKTKAKNDSKPVVVSSPPKPSITKTPVSIQDKQHSTIVVPVKKKDKPAVDKLKPVPTATPVPHSIEPKNGWYSWADGYRVAQQTGKPILLKVGFKGCPACEAQEKDLAKLDLKKFVCIMVDIYIDTTFNQTAFKINNSYPVLMVWNVSTGQVTGRMDGYSGGFFDKRALKRMTGN